MGSTFVVPTTPLLDNDPGFGQASKDFSVQTLLAKCAVETFITAVLPGLARFDIGQLYLLSCQLLLQCLGEQFAAVIAADGTRATVACNQLALQRFDVRVLQVLVGLDCQTIARRFILDREAT